MERDNYSEISVTIYSVYGYILQNNGKLFVEFCELKSLEYVNLVCAAAIPICY